MLRFHFEYLDYILLVGHWQPREAGFVSTRDPVFGHAVHALPHLYATVIVMSQTEDHDLEQGQEGESGSSLPSEC